MSHIKKHIIIGNVECKVCNKCGQTLPLSAFSRHARTFDGYQVTCKSFSNCGRGSGYCLRIKVGCRSNNVCGDYQPNVTNEYKQVAKPVRVFNLTPYD